MLRKWGGADASLQFYRVEVVGGINKRKEGTAFGKESGRVSLSFLKKKEKFWSSEISISLVYIINYYVKRT